MYFSSFPSVCNFEYEDLAIFDAFAKLRKATISFVMSVQTSVRPIDCLSVGQHGTSHCKCFTATVAVPHYTMCVLRCDSCCSTLHTVSASLRQLLFHSSHCKCFTATDAVPLYTMCVLHCDSCSSTLHNVCASLWQMLFHSSHCKCFTVTVAVPLFTL
jgi:hypothetical protein